MAAAHGSDRRKIRVVVAKPGLDGHDRGAKIIARALRDAGMEVIYTGLHQTPEQIVETVLQEDADAVGLSILSGAHMTLVPRVVELLREQEAGDVVVTVGGTIPAQDIPELKQLGVAEVFTPGAPTSDIIDFIRGAVTREARRDAAGDSLTVQTGYRRPTRPCPSASSSPSRSPPRSPRRSRCATPTASPSRSRRRSSCRLRDVVLAALARPRSSPSARRTRSGPAPGTAAIAVIGIVALGEPATAIKLASIALIVAGVIGLNLAGATDGAPDRRGSCSTPRSP